MWTTCYCCCYTGGRESWTEYYIVKLIKQRGNLHSFETDLHMLALVGIEVDPLALVVDRVTGLRRVEVIHIS